MLYFLRKVSQCNFNSMSISMASSIVNRHINVWPCSEKCVLSDSAIKTTSLGLFPFWSHTGKLSMASHHQKIAARFQIKVFSDTADQGWVHFRRETKKYKSLQEHQDSLHLRAWIEIEKICTKQMEFYHSRIQYKISKNMVGLEVQWAFKLLGLKQWCLFSWSFVGVLHSGDSCSSCDS